MNQFCRLYCVGIMKTLVINVTLLILVGCVSKVDKLSYLETWNDKWQECDKVGKETTIVFPQSDWFKSLTLDNKRKVFLYIHFLKDYECTQEEAEKLKSVLSEYDITTLNEVLKGFIYFDMPSNVDVKHLDEQQLIFLSNQILGPFNAITTAEAMGLIKHE